MLLSFIRFPPGPGGLVWSGLGCHRNIQSRGFLGVLKSKTRTNRWSGRDRLENKPSDELTAHSSQLTQLSHQLIVCLIEFLQISPCDLLRAGLMSGAAEGKHFLYTICGQLTDTNNSSMHCNELSGIRLWSMDGPFQHNIITIQSLKYFKYIQSNSSSSLFIILKSSTFGFFESYQEF